MTNENEIEVSSQHEHEVSDSELSALKKEVFKEQDGMMNKLVKDGAVNFFRQEFPDLRHAFIEPQRCVCCADEGTAHMDINGEAKFALAGSGILYPAGGEAERLEKVAKIMIERGVKNITSHDGCGAGGEAFKRAFPEADPHDPDLAQKIAAYTKAWADKLADKMRELGHDAERTHIPANEMVRPEKFHNARVIYFDGVGGFNPNKEVDLPKGFVVERKYLPADYAATELGFLSNIAFGHHGFGELFTADNPFVLIAMARTADEADSLKKEIETTLAENENFKSEKIKIDAIVIE
ncbi:MAG: hypothetical protein WC457_02435 [Patescibacteria group bacterium]